MRGSYQAATIVDLSLVGDEVVRMEFVLPAWRGYGHREGGGQWLNLWMPAISMAELHPMSICCSPGQDDAGKRRVVLYVRALGQWSSRLYCFVKEQQEQLQRRKPEAKIDWSHLYLFVEGAYGGSYQLTSLYSRVLIFAGGIGFTPMHSIFAELMEDVHTGRGYCGRKPVQRDVRWVCSLREPDLVDEFAALHFSARSGGQVGVEGLTNCKDVSSISIGNAQGDLEGARDSKCVCTSYFYMTNRDLSYSDRARLEAYSFIRFGRPSVADLVEEFAQGSGSPIDVQSLIIVCGPMAMVKDVRYAAAKHAINCHSETFQF